MARVDYIDLDKLRYAVQVTASNTVFKDSVSVETDMATHLVAALTYHVMGKTLERKSVSWPTTWWDAFKLRWYPRWAQALWPVSLSYFESTGKALFLDIPLSVSRIAYLLDDKRGEYHQPLGVKDLTLAGDLGLHDTSNFSDDRDRTSVR